LAREESAKELNSLRLKGRNALYKYYQEKDIDATALLVTRECPDITQESMRSDTFQATTKLTQLVNVQAGGSKKQYLIRTERGSGRKYVLQRGRKWFLDMNRGKYRYANGSKTEIYVCGGH
jgi:hypothetical protein